MMTVVPLATAHLEAVAWLHLQHLRTHYVGYAGRQLLTRYYSSIISSTHAACGYIAIEEDHVAGFVCGVWDPDALRSTLLKEHLPGLIIWSAIHALRQPALIAQMMARLRASSASTGEDLAHEGYELRPIVVDPRFRGTGVAQQLVNCLIEDAARRGFRTLFLYTESDNTAANHFYTKMGFRHVEAYHSRGETYFRYEIATD